MKQKYETYTVNRAEETVNSIGERVKSTTKSFKIKAILTMSSGDTAINNLVQQTTSTHNLIYIYSDVLLVDDVIVGEDGEYRVDYAYKVGKNKIATLTRVV